MSSTIAVPSKLYPNEIELYRELILERTGLSFGPSRAHLLQAAILDETEARGCYSPMDLYRVVVANATDFANFIERLLNHETSFFRHRPSFEFLGTRVFPELARRLETDRRTRAALWCPGCSIGSEPYSIAMLAEETCFQAEHSLSIIGTDYSAVALERAKQGWYYNFELRGLPDSFRAKYVSPETRGDEPGFRFSLNLRQQVQFVQRGLIDESNRGQEFDVVFCQNVLIYFAPAQRLIVLDRLIDSLRRGGWLILGPADVVGLTVPGLTAIDAGECVVYRK